jgi:hypothetical protein
LIPGFWISGGGDGGTGADITEKNNYLAEPGSAGLLVRRKTIPEAEQILRICGSLFELLPPFVYLLFVRRISFVR